MKDNLFDKEFTFLDAVKILMLIATAFSTWNIVKIMTPQNSISFVREFAAVGIVEGAFIGFEMATAKAKSKRQVNFSTIGFFCSLAVIVLFAGASGLLEFGGADLLSQPAGNWLGMNWTAKDAISGVALLVFIVWLGALASLHRLYTLNDPDKKAELARISLFEKVSDTANAALSLALEKSAPVVAATRALANVRATYSAELNSDQMQELQANIKACLDEQYSSAPIPAPAPFVRNQQVTPPLSELGDEDK